MPDPTGDFPVASAVSHERICRGRALMTAVPPSPKELLDRGLHLHQEGFPQKAARFYRQAADAGADGPAHDLLGVVAIELKRYAEAENHLRRALAYEPAMTSALGHRGSALVAQGKLTPAICSFHRALAVSGSDPLWLRNLGLALVAAGERAAARRALSSALEHSPSNAALLNDLGLVAIGDGETPRGRGLFRSALAVDPLLSETLVNLGLVELDLDDTRAARRLVGRAGISAPTSPDVLNGLGAAALA